MKNNLYPLLFAPVYKDYIWGGNRLTGLYGRILPAGRCAESWEVADRPEGMSVAVNGPLAGRSLRDLMLEFGSALAGSRGVRTSGKSREGLTPVFPLLIKIIDAHERLSVQVHPDDSTAPLCGGEAKTEMWYVLDAPPGARVFAGLKPGTNEAGFRGALAAGRVEDFLRSVPVCRGMAIYIPGGRVHAIGEGCLLLEVQQNSNTTYRVHDWNRVDRDGKPRELHVEQALGVVDWLDRDDPTRPARPVPEDRRNSVSDVIRTPCFHVERLDAAVEASQKVDPESFQILFCVSGSARAAGPGVEVCLKPGVSCLIPACVGKYDLIPETRSSLIRISLG